jgi:Spy/CpxP family protein refolding chaperone
MIEAVSYQPGGFMIGSKFKKILTAAAASAVVMGSATAFAQAPGGGPPPGGGMMRGPMDRPTMISRLGLDDAALKLSDAQKGQIDKLVDGYIAEQATMRAKYPMTPGSPPSQDMMTAMRSSRENLNTAVGKVLNDSQRATWEAGMAARRPPGGPGGPGGPPPAR